MTLEDILGSDEVGQELSLSGKDKYRTAEPAPGELRSHIKKSEQIL